jgi:hypothetical protein
MKKEEADTLIRKKIKEGKAPTTIIKELYNLDISSKEIKGQNREIIRLNRIISKKDAEISKLKKKVFDLQLKEDTKK